MEYTTKHKIFVVGGILMGLLLAGLIIFFLVSGRNQTEVNNAPAATKGDEQPPPPPEEFSLPTAKVPDTPLPILSEPVAPTPEAEQQFVLQQARTFVERFGTYSSHNDNAHIDDVLALATPRMQLWLASQGIAQTTAYTGATTRVIERRMDSFTNSAATVRVGVQKNIQDGSGQKSEYLHGTVQLVRSAGSWLVDGIYWDATP